MSAGRADAAFALELELDRREAALAPELRAHARAALARALADRDPPPPPVALLEPAWLALPARAAATGAPSLVARAAALARASLQARAALAPAVREASAGARELDGLAARHAALARIAPGLGLPDARALVAALYGAPPLAGDALAPLAGDALAPRAALYGAVPFAGDALVPLACDALAPRADSDDADVVDETRAPCAAGALPSLAELRDRLAARAAIDPAPIALHRGPRALTIVVAPGAEVHCVVPDGDDALATLVLAAHELGHGLLAAALPRSTPPGAPIVRVDDEAAAARAVRALEEPAVIPDAAARAALARRRRRRERLTAALARFEGACLAGVPAAEAWAVVAAIDPRRPAAFPSLLDEPGVMAAYHAADRAAAGAAP